MSLQKMKMAANYKKLIPLYELMRVNGRVLGKLTFEEVEKTKYGYHVSRQIYSKTYRSLWNHT